MLREEHVVNEIHAYRCRGEKDPSFPPAVMKSVADSISGPVGLYCLRDGKHQLMLFHTEVFSNKVDEWARQQIKEMGYEQG